MSEVWRQTFSVELLKGKSLVDSWDFFSRVVKAAQGVLDLVGYFTLEYLEDIADK